MMSETQQVVANLQHSLLFLQQEHTRTLQDLQKQISTLQKKCTDQNFQLTLLNLSHDGDSPVIHLEAEVSTLKNTNGELRTMLESKEKRVTFLEEQMKSKERRYQDDLKNASRKIQELELELDNRAANVAYMTTQLHQSKLINLQNENGHVTVEIQNTLPQTKLIRTSSPAPVLGALVDAAASERVAFSPSPPKHIIKAGRSVRRSLPSPVATASLDGAISESGSSQQLPAGSEVTSAAMSKSSSKLASYTHMPKQLALREDDGPARPSIGLSQARRDRYGELRLANSGVALTQRRAMGNAQPVHRPNDYDEMIRISKSTDKSAKKIQLAPPGKAEPLPPIVTHNGRQIRKGNSQGIGTSRAIGKRVVHQAQASKHARAGEIEQLMVEPLASPEKHFRTTAGPAHNSSK